MNPAISLPEPGQLVDVRCRRYVVVDVTQDPLASIRDALKAGGWQPQHLVTLSSVEDDALGEDLQVIWEIEPGAIAIHKTPLPEPVGFDAPQRLDTFLNAVRWGGASSADVRAIQAPFRSGVTLEDYQLDPVARAIQMPRVNLLIADDVGLGKTIEAGLVAQELIIRHRARRILIVCPAALQVQWRDQMRDKFGLEFRVIDSELMRTLRRERGLITSIDFLKRERPLRLFREVLPASGESVYPRRFDLLIVDEAHNIAPSGRGKYATEQYATEFVVKLLKKRLFSSPEAFYATLQQHMASLTSATRHVSVTRRPGMGILRGKIEQLEEESDNDEALDDSTGEALEVTAPLFRAPDAREQRLLAQMLAWAESARHRPDSKAQQLIDWLHRTLKPGGRWNDERVILFTEYRATQNWLCGLLAREGFAEKGPDGEKRLLTLYGGMDTREREAIKAAFQADPAQASVRILLATDAASEGIDLQNHCSRLFHYEIPWNPNRLEQRNGRIDRHGQRAPRVDIYHFVGSTYSDASDEDIPVGKLDADLYFLKVAINKIERIREDLGNVGPVIAQQVEEAMLGRRRRLDTSRAEANAPSRRLLAFERKQKEKLEERIRQLYEQLREGKRELGMTPQNIQAVVETALSLANLPPLQPRILRDPLGKRPDIEVFDVPELGGSWAMCSSGLEHPHTHLKRPIVFNHDLAKERDDVVLAHLNSRLVAMSLRLLRAEIWASGDQRKLYRVTARIVPNDMLDTPAVLAHARLLILGGDNTRLHEELVVAGGYLREGRFARMNERQLREAQAAATRAPAPEAIQQRLKSQWETHRDAQALEARMRDRAASLQKTLAERAGQEQRDIRLVLSELQQSILQELRQPEGVTQLELAGFSTEERLQVERNLTALQARVQEIDAEIVEEVQRIARRFDDPQPRLFPVAVTYLVPEGLE